MKTLQNLTLYPIQLPSMDSLSHFITGEELTVQQTEKILHKALMLKKGYFSTTIHKALRGYHLALLFEKPSLRTRFSFTVAMRELGGDIIESSQNTRKKETPEDQARVLSGYCDAVMIRTHQHDILERMSSVSAIPIINGLSNLYHPCQILADLLTLQEIVGNLRGLTLSYIGDGNNILHSLLLLAPAMGINIHYCCPATREPNGNILAHSIKKTVQAGNSMGVIKAFAKPELAVTQAQAVYTDVWTSMGFEAEANDDLFTGFQVNEQLMTHAQPDAIFMHCLPMVRGKEVSQTLPDSQCSVIFQQSENRLHVQKALLLHLLKKGNNDDA